MGGRLQATVAEELAPWSMLNRNASCSELDIGYLSSHMLSDCNFIALTFFGLVHDFQILRRLLHLILLPPICVTIKLTAMDCVGDGAVMVEFSAVAVQVSFHAHHHICVPATTDPRIPERFFRRFSFRKTDSFSQKAFPRLTPCSRSCRRSTSWVYSSRSCKPKACFLAKIRLVSAFSPAR